MARAATKWTEKVIIRIESFGCLVGPYFPFPTASRDFCYIFEQDKLFSYKVLVLAAMNWCGERQFLRTN